MKNVLILLLLLSFAYCKKPTKCYNRDTTVYVLFIDDEGNNLLDIGTTNHYLFEKMVLYNLIDGKKEEIYNANFDSPRNLEVRKLNNKNYLGIGLETDSTILKLNENDEDTLTSVFHDFDCGFTLEKLDYNGTTVWTEGIKEITIVKNIK